jgi:class 3 adenylate cyclase
LQGGKPISQASAQRAILFADVCDSTTIYQAIGDTQAFMFIAGLLSVLQEGVRQHGGSVVKSLGDGLVCQFPEADQAFQAACELQLAADKFEPADNRKLAIKVVFTWGPVVTEAGDVFGDTVNVCARLVGLANADQVLTTQETVDALSPNLRHRCRHLFPAEVRGRVGEIEVCDVLWRADADVTEAFGQEELAAARRDWILKLSYAGETLVVEPRGSIKLGRDKTNDMVVNSTKASRVHARIYERGGNFMIADQSSNGTYVALDGNTRELALRREETVLGERGYIGLGSPTAGHGDHVLRYRLEARKP